MLCGGGDAAHARGVTGREQRREAGGSQRTRTRLPPPPPACPASCCWSAHAVAVGTVGAAR
jgi:hypothetical protein